MENGFELFVTRLLLYAFIVIVFGVVAHLTISIGIAAITRILGFFEQRFSKIFQTKTK